MSKKKPSMMSAGFGRNEAQRLEHERLRKLPKPVPVPKNGELRPLLKKATPLDSRRQCAFVIGDPSTSDFAYCGRKSVPGESYCDHHLARCINPVRR